MPELAGARRPLRPYTFNLNRRRSRRLQLRLRGRRGRMIPPRRILAEYPTHDALVAALRRLREAGYTRLEVYTPFPSEEIDDLLPGPPTRIGWVMFVGGLLGGGGAYFMEWYAAHDYAYNVGSRPLHSWPSFVPVTFELTVLISALSGLLALLWFTRLPRLDHPVFASAAFERASQDRFFIAIRNDDPRITASGLDRLLEETSPLSIEEIFEEDDE